MNSWTKKAKYHQVSDSTNIQYWSNFEPTETNSLNDVIVFNYGLVCNINHFTHQIDYFDKLGHKIVLHDYRGHYESQTSEGIESITFENISNDIKSLLTFLGVNRSIHIGHSMGVNVTLDYANRFPTDVSKMILISGTVFPPQDVMFDSNIVDIAEPVIMDIQKKFEKTFSKLWGTAYLNPLAKLLVWNGGFNMKKTDIDFVEHYMKQLGKLDPKIFFQLLDQMKDQTIIKDLDKIKTPTLVMGGDKDKVIPNYLQQIITKGLSNSELYIIKNGSHVPQVDFPEFTNERIELFLS